VGQPMLGSTQPAETAIAHDKNHASGERPMKLFYAAAAVLALASPAFAFDPTVAEIVDNLKPKAMVDTTDLAELMKGSERWCYAEEDGTCQWSDVYLDVSEAGPRLEVSSGYSDDYDLYIVDKGEFRNDRYVCEYGYDWTPSTRLVRRTDGTPVNGRELDAMRVQFAANFGTDRPHCFDYLFVRANAEAGTITLLQRTYDDFIQVKENDVAVTLHFDADEAAALTLRP
jgi:hypothetical protein